MAEANARNVLIALIESRKGVENAEAILAVPGIDAGWLGHFDLTSDLGIPAQFHHPEFLAAVDRLAAASERTGKPLGLLDARPELLRHVAGKGFRILGYANDVTALRRGLSRGLEEVRAAFDGKEPSLA
jgi:2-dehydro-3-deoxyglucarate aldolase/4-hydroxy-2-oxoheptanedioate aldolase